MSNHADVLDAEPEVSAETSLVPVPVDDSPPSSSATWQGNSYDATAFVGALLGGLILLTCFTCNFGFYCWPVLAIIFGIIGLVNAKDSLDPERTKLLSWIGVGTGGVIIALIAVLFVLYFGFIIFAIAMEGGGF